MGGRILEEVNPYGGNSTKDYFLRGRYLKFNIGDNFHLH